jgi:regulator of protease activity HflC (stomatin/prohibitin superfamily)
MNERFLGVLALCVMALVVAGVLFANVVHVVSPKDIVVYQSVFGNMEVWKTPGPRGQWFGTVTTYHKSSQFWFSKLSDQGNTTDQSIPVKFNDGGHASISGSLRYDLPEDDKSMFQLHQKFGSQQAIDHQLIRTVVEKAVYMTGPLMSSKESYAERRSELISDIEVQATEGVLQTTTEDVRTVDPISGQSKTVSVVRISKDKSGNPIVREVSPLKNLNIKLSNFSINSVTYSEVVENQIKQQQAALMEIQTAMANARKAEQAIITVKSEGEANAAKAKWEQEVLKAKAVTEAEQNKAVAFLAAAQAKEVALTKAEQEKSVALTNAARENEVATIDANKKLRVAELAKQAAEFTKNEQILIGQGNAKRRELELNADGALGLRLDAYKEVMAKAYENLGKQRWVSEINMGGGSSGNQQGASALNNMMELLAVKTAKDLALDLGVPPVKRGVTIIEVDPKQ